MFMSPTDPEEVSRIITSLKPNNIFGHGGVSSKLLKTLKPAICEPISIVINKSLGTNMKIPKLYPFTNPKKKN
ncbi:hypothetical protein LSH36_228g04026 [Paralvinella palmiformis]|uniref:Uncharacterized protein n=1 Tax=Paralvinella palmiformis TaxID=53620 RepID=A0AAD9N5M4_9ANNE|nr:hypothetical protein LSH36_228g04026 [Paralvinella palmiformis]